MPSPREMTPPPEGMPETHTRRHVEIVPMGSVDGVALSVVAANLQAIAGLLADTAPAVPDPDYALIPARRQYNAVPILTALEKDIPERGLRLGIVSGDLCLPIFSYVLGEAQVGGRAAVVSLFRLGRGGDGRPVEPSRVYERLAKVSLHEIAHVLGLRHCRDPQCLMQFSPGAEHIDELAMGFCEQCEALLGAACREMR